MDELILLKEILDHKDPSLMKLIDENIELFVERLKN